MHSHYAFSYTEHRVVVLVYEGQQLALFEVADHAPKQLHGIRTGRHAAEGLAQFLREVH